MRSSRFYTGVFLVTLSTLMLQLIQTRILSVVLWYHLAFFVISIAMFGLTAGAVWVYLRHERFTAASLPRDLAYMTAAFAVTAALAVAVQMTLSPTFQLSLTFVVAWVELALVLALPFFFSGVVVSLALTRSPFPIGQVYGVDLLGAAAGCVVAVVLLDHTDGPSAVLWVAAIAAAGAYAFATSATDETVEGGPAKAKTRPPFAAVLGRPGVLALVFAVVALLNSSSGYGLKPLYVKDQPERRGAKLLHEEWNSYSRVTAVAGRGRLLYGASPTMPRQTPMTVRVLTIDGRASTPIYPFTGERDKVEFLKYDITNLAYYLPGRKRGAVVGVGGGRDVLAARVFGLEDVTGVEINPIFIDLLTRDEDFSRFAGLADLTGVRFVVDEARSWFARSRERFDVIQMSMIDTWAATGAGAFTLSENGLYTMEAWDIFLDRLEDDGVFTVSRWYAPGEVNETGRMISLAAGTLLRRGAEDPRRHMVVAALGNVATLVLSPSPLAEDDLEALLQAARKLRFKVLLSPREEPPSELLAAILGARDLTELAEVTAGYDLDLSPPVDDKPFFFNQLPFYRPSRILRLARLESQDGVIAGNLQAAATLFVILLVSLFLVVATIVVPLLPALRSSEEHISGRLVGAGTAYFLFIGLGFMAVEIGLLQRLSVLLGHPIYALGVVLMSIILTTGVGSLVSDLVPLTSRGRFLAWAVAVGGYVLSLPLWWSGLFLAFDSASLPVRIALAVAVILPAGFLMGFGFPTGMRMAAAIDDRPTPWFWGINGAAGVLGSTLGLAISIAFGIGTTVMFGGLCYLLLIAPGLALLPGKTDVDAPSDFR